MNILFIRPVSSARLYKLNMKVDTSPMYQLMLKNKTKHTASNPVKARGILKKDFEPDWITGNLGIYPVKTEQVNKTVKCVDELEGVRVQQDDLLKPLLEDIVSYGLNYVYKNYTNAKDDHDQYKYTTTSNPKRVIIIGAGMAGLSAAYELTKVGHNVKILEMQPRVGGRVKTLGEKDGFAKHCYANAGAMRFPGKPDSAVKMHYLTNYYADTEFGLKLLPFNNADDNAWLKFYGKNKIKISDWIKNSEENFSHYWPGWDARIVETNAKEEYDIRDIGTYYLLTTDIVANQLKQRLQAADGDNAKEADVWNKWTMNWSKFSVTNFLLSTRDTVTQLLDENHQLSTEESEKLDKFIPWPEEAVKAYSIYTYAENLDQSLVQYLRDQLAKWLSNNMHQIEGGSGMLPDAFIKQRKLPNWKSDSIHLEEKIMFNVTVDEIEYEATDHDDLQTQTVTVTGYHTNSGQPIEVHGDAVIITSQLHVIHHIKFVAKKNTTPPEQLNKFFKALDDLWQLPSTKIMIQCKDKFWEAEGIKGGCSISTLPIGKVYYPTYTENSPSKQGILTCYALRYEAYSLGALQPQLAIHEAVRQIAEFHPQIREKFEVGAVQAWTNEPFAPGAHVIFKPQQYLTVQELFMYPCLNMFFAGDGISFTIGWIQGALQSGLRAAYQFYSRNESSSSQTTS